MSLWEMCSDITWSGSMHNVMVANVGVPMTVSGFYQFINKFHHAKGHHNGSGITWSGIMNNVIMANV